MNVLNALLDPLCMADIRDEPSESTWAECARDKAAILSGVALAGMIIVVLIFVCWGSTADIRHIAIAAGMLSAGIAVLYTVVWAPRAARVEHRRFSEALSRRIRNGVSRAEALSSLQDDILKKDQIGAMPGPSLPWMR